MIVTDYGNGQRAVRRLLHLEQDDGVLRDETGAVVGERAGKDKELLRLSRLAAKWMRAPTMMTSGDLAPSDVLRPGTRAYYGIPNAEKDFVADEVSPVGFVDKFQGYYYVENVADQIKLRMFQASLTGQPPEVNPGFAATEFTTVGYAVACKLPQEVIGNADFPLRRQAVRYLVDLLRRAREARVATQLTTSTNFATANRIAAVAKWDGGTNPAQLTDVFAALAASYMPADTLILPEIAAQYFYYTPAGSTGAQIRDFIQGGGQLPRILYARAKQLYNKAAAYVWMPSGVGSVPLVRTTHHDAYWENHSWPKRRLPNKEEEEREPEWEMNDIFTDIGTSTTLRWLGDGGVRDGLRRHGLLVREYEEMTDRSHWIVVAHNDIEIMPSNQVGAIITGAIA